MNSLEDEASLTMGNDFFMYNLNEKKWTLISSDTSNQNGPLPISSGQMCIDVNDKIIYVFGGRTEQKIHPFQGNTALFYSYNIKAGTWDLLDLKRNNSEAIFNDFSAIYENECYGHCMIFNPKKKEIVIYGGIVKSNLISDFFTISTVDFTIKRIQFPNVSMPSIAFHKGCYSSRTDSFYFYSGYFKNIHGVFQANYLFECNLVQKKFRRIYQDFNIDRDYWYKQSIVLEKFPMPRFSHQFLYSAIRDEFFLFGGNPNQPFSVLKKRLNDLWILKVIPHKKEDLVKKITFLLKKLRFFVMIKNNFGSFEILQQDFQELNKLAIENEENNEISNILKGSLLWGKNEVEKEKIEVFTTIKNMCHSEKIKKRKFFLSYMDY